MKIVVGLVNGDAWLYKTRQQHDRKATANQGDLHSEVGNDDA